MYGLGKITLPFDKGFTLVREMLTGGFQDMTGLPVFILLERYLKVAPIYKLAIGPRSIVVGD